MRCTRCDGISFEDVLARDQDGRLIFGWCEACILEEGYEIVQPTAAPIRVRQREPLTRKIRRLRRAVKRAANRPRSEAAIRRLAGLGIVGMMLLWALILAFVGGVKLIAAPDGKGPWLLVAAGAMAVFSLCVWIAIIGYEGGLRFLLRVIHVAGMVAGFGILAWGILSNRRERAAMIALAACSSLGVSWAAKSVERRLQAPRMTDRRARRDSETEDLASGESTR